MSDKLTASEFAARIKKKYPEYADINDKELTQKVINKYPEYRDQVDLGIDLGDVAKGGAAFAADIAISEVGRSTGTVAGLTAGAAIGSAVPGIGTAVGAGVGALVGYIGFGLGAGAAGSRVRQKIMNPDKEIDQGQVLADSLINLVPVIGKGKSLVKTIGANAAAGAGISGGAEVVESIVNKGELPTQDDLLKAGMTGAILGGGLGITGKAFDDAYSKFGGRRIDDLTAAFRRGDPDAKILVDGTEKTAKEFSDEIAKRYEEFGIDLREKYDDQFIRARLLQDISAGGQIRSKDGKLAVSRDEVDYYLQRRLAEGKIETANQRIQDELTLDNAFIVNKSDELNMTPLEASKMVDNYLYAKHAIRYNAENKFKYAEGTDDVIERAFGKEGAAGIETSKAKSIIDEFERAGLDKTFKTVIDSRRDMSKRILNTLEDGGLISAKEADILRKKYPDYVPLNRIMDDDDIGDISRVLKGSNAKYEVITSGVQKAKGSPREVSNIQQNIADALSGAIRRAEVNKANQAFLKLVRENPVQAKQYGIKIKKALGADDDRKAALTVFEGGDKVYVKFTDPKLAAVYKGFAPKELGPILKAGYAYNRFIGGLYTRFNPEFIIPNLFRDRSEAFVNAMRTMKGTEAIGLLNPFSATKDVQIARRVLFNKPAKNAQEEAEHRLYKEFLDSGASTGGLGLDTARDIEKSLKDLSKELSAPSNRKFKQFIRFTNKSNSIFEDATRFGTYKRLRQKGVSKDQAALAARNSSFDPTLKGTEGDALKALYLFSNPAIQGAKNFIRSMKNPKIAAAVMSGLSATAYTLHRHNVNEDPQYREKIPKWKLDKHLTVVTGKKEDGSLKYISIPIGYSMVPFKMLAEKGVLMMTEPGEISAEKAAKETAELGKAFVDSYNPMGGSVIPTFFRPFAELAQNKDGLGRDIRPSWLEKPSVAAHERIYAHTADTFGGELAMVLAEQAKDISLSPLVDEDYRFSPEDMLYLYQNYFGGPGATVKRLFNVTAKMYNGDKVDSNDIPILRRFYGESYADVFERRTGDRSELENLSKQEGTERARSQRTTDILLKRINEAKTLPEKRSVLLDQIKNNPDVTADVVRRLETKLSDQIAGITSVDRKIKTLSPARRAEFFANKIKSLPPAQVELYLIRQEQIGNLNEKTRKLLLESEQFKNFFQR